MMVLLLMPSASSTASASVPGELFPNHSILFLLFLPDTVDSECQGIVFFVLFVLPSMAGVAGLNIVLHEHLTGETNQQKNKEANNMVKNVLQEGDA